MKKSQRSDPFDFNDTLCVLGDNPEQLTIPRSTLEKLLHHAASAAHLVGHLDDKAHAELIRQLGDHVDTIAHEPRGWLAPSALVGSQSPPQLAHPRRPCTRERSAVELALRLVIPCNHRSWYGARPGSSVVARSLMSHIEVQPAETSRTENVSPEQGPRQATRDQVARRTPARARQAR
jgi:hypothetical protein